jgi:hypothetical protein
MTTAISHGQRLGRRGRTRDRRRTREGQAAEIRPWPASRAPVAERARRGQAREQQQRPGEPWTTTPAWARRAGSSTWPITAGRATAIVTMQTVMAKSSVRMSSACGRERPEEAAAARIVRPRRPASAAARSQTRRLQRKASRTRSSACPAHAGRRRQIFGSVSCSAS